MHTDFNYCKFFVSEYFFRCESLIRVFYVSQILRIERDKEFWDQYLRPKLSKFFTECILPELVDPRIPRGMSIREPNYIVEAQKTLYCRSSNSKMKHDDKNQQKAAKKI